MPQLFSVLEQKVLSEVSSQLLMKHTQEISKYVRISGSEDEARSLEYIKRILAGYGFRMKEHRFDAYIGYPETAALHVTSPESRKIDGCSAALAPSTPLQGTEAELVYVGLGDAEAFSKVDVKGKLVLAEGIAEPEVAKRADDHEALGEVFINDEFAHEGIVSVVWGTPTHETASLLPETPCISISDKDGTYLKRLLETGKVQVRLTARTWRGWKKIPVLTAELRGSIERDRYVLLSGHIDSWYYGAMDNASANAMMIEVARIMSKHRKQLRRGLRVAFWSGHSHGRYAGSTWYADNFWFNLEKNCVANINADSLGSKGATVLTEASVMPEAWDFASSITDRVVGQKLAGRRFSRAGDQSFWGIGIPSIFMSLSEIPVEASKRDQSLRTVTIFGPSPTGSGWWWHTQYDTLDKIDADNLNRDTKVYALVTLALCTSAILPFNYQKTAGDIKKYLNELQTLCGEKFDLRPLLERANKLATALAKLNRAATRSRGNRKTEVINATIMRLGRLLVPLTYTSKGRFEHDLAILMPPLPCLDDVRRMANLDENSDEFKFLSNGMRRNSNRVASVLDEALELVNSNLRLL